MSGGQDRKCSEPWGFVLLVRWSKRASRVKLPLEVLNRAVNLKYAHPVRSMQDLPVQVGDFDCVTVDKT